MLPASTFHSSFSANGAEEICSLLCSYVVDRTLRQTWCSVRDRAARAATLPSAQTLRSGRGDVAVRGRLWMPSGRGATQACANGERVVAHSCFFLKPGPRISPSGIWPRRRGCPRTPMDAVRAWNHSSLCKRGKSGSPFLFFLEAEAAH